MELEIKIRVPSLEDFEEKLDFAEFVGEEHQRDTYFKMPERELLRVRVVDGGKALLGHKAIRDEANTEFDEVECGVGEGEVMMEILKRLGYREWITIEKVRRTYRYRDMTFELNRVRHLGDFVDMEIMTEDPGERGRIMAMIERLGYSEEDIEPRLYSELLVEKGFMEE
jgi:adenylate cyclase class 2